MINLDGNDFNDEIAKIYAMHDMKEERKESFKKQADLFYDGFDHNSVENTGNTLIELIHNNELSLTRVNDMLSGMIKIFEQYEEYEKCHLCNQIKKYVNDKI